MDIQSKHVCQRVNIANIKIAVHILLKKMANGKQNVCQQQINYYLVVSQAVLKIYTSVHLLTCYENCSDKTFGTNILDCSPLLESFTTVYKLSIYKTVSVETLTKHSIYVMKNCKLKFFHLPNVALKNFKYFPYI